VVEAFVVVVVDEDEVEVLDEVELVVGFDVDVVEDVLVDVEDELDVDEVVVGTRVVVAWVVVVGAALTACGAALSLPLLFPQPAAPVNAAVTVWLPTASGS